MSQAAGEIAIVVGSLRKASFSRKVAAILAQKLGGRGKSVEIAGLPLYNEDLESDAPQAWRDFRTQLQGCSGFLFVTPEYNRSIPAPLKNAIDVGSRPMKQSVWNGKPAGVVSVSRGALGAFGANHHLRQSLAGVNVRVLPHPEIYLGGIANLLDEAGKLTNPDTENLLDGFVAAFTEWVRVLG